MSKNNPAMESSSGIKRRDANDILSANNVVPGFTGNSDIVDQKTIRDKAIKKIWGDKKTIKQEVRENYEEYEKKKRGRPKVDTQEN